VPGQEEEKLNVRALFAMWAENCPAMQIPVGASLIAMALCLATFFCVHIRFFGHGHLRFRLYGGLLGRAPSNQGLLPLTFGASPRLGIPSLRSCSVGPPRSAIHGRTRLTRHPCRVAHCAEPALGLSRGQEDQKPKQKPKRGGLLAGLIAIERVPPVGASLLAKNARTPRAFRQPASSLTSIASKLAPIEEQSQGMVRSSESTRAS